MGNELITPVVLIISVLVIGIVAIRKGWIGRLKIWFEGFGGVEVEGGKADQTGPKGPQIRAHFFLQGKSQNIQSNNVVARQDVVLSNYGDDVAKNVQIWMKGEKRFGDFFLDVGARDIRFRKEFKYKKIELDEDEIPFRVVYTDSRSRPHITKQLLVKEGGDYIVHRSTFDFEPIASSTDCPCGSGKKYTKCHGK